MRIYISGPVTGRNDYEEHFALAEQMIKESLGENIQIINPVRVLGELPDMEYEDMYAVA